MTARLSTLYDQDYNVKINLAGSATEGDYNVDSMTITIQKDRYLVVLNQFNK